MRCIGAWDRTPGPEDNRDDKVAETVEQYLNNTLPNDRNVKVANTVQQSESMDMKLDFSLFINGMNRFPSWSELTAIETAVKDYLEKTGNRCKLVSIIAKPPFLIAYVDGPVTNTGGNREPLALANQTVLFSTPDQDIDLENLLPLGSPGGGVRIDDETDGIALAVDPRNLMRKAIKALQNIGVFPMQITWDGSVINIWTAKYAIEEIIYNRDLPYTMMGLPCDCFDLSSNNLFNSRLEAVRNFEPTSCTLQSQVVFDSTVTGPTCGRIVAVGWRDIVWDRAIRETGLQEKEGSNEDEGVEIWMAWIATVIAKGTMDVI